MPAPGISALTPELRHRLGADNILRAPRPGIRAGRPGRGRLGRAGDHGGGPAAARGFRHPGHGHLGADSNPGGTGLTGGTGRAADRPAGPRSSHPAPARAAAAAAPVRTGASVFGQRPEHGADDGRGRRAQRARAGRYPDRPLHTAQPVTVTTSLRVVTADLILLHMRLATSRDAPRHRPSRCHPGESCNPSPAGAAGVPAAPDPRSS